MTATQRIKSDLDFVRGVVNRSDRAPSPTAIYVLWAIIVLVGFPLADFAPKMVPLFWTIAGPGGGVLSAFLGYRHGKRIGQQDRARGNRHMLHWAGMLVGIFSVVVLHTFGSIEGDALHQVILLMIGMSYFFAGIHLERPLIWVGILTWAAYFSLFIIPAYEWTVVAIVIAAGLIAAGLAGRGRSDDAG